MNKCPCCKQYTVLDFPTEPVWPMVYTVVRQCPACGWIQSRKLEHLNPVGDRFDRQSILAIR